MWWLEQRECETPHSCFHAAALHFTHFSSVKRFFGFHWMTTRGRCWAWEDSPPTEHHAASSVVTTSVIYFQKYSPSWISRHQDRMWLRVGDAKVPRVFTSSGALIKSLHWSSLTFTTSRPLRKPSRAEQRTSALLRTWAIGMLRSLRTDKGERKSTAWSESGKKTRGWRWRDIQLTTS